MFRSKQTSRISYGLQTYMEVENELVSRIDIEMVMDLLKNPIVFQQSGRKGCVLSNQTINEIKKHIRRGLSDKEIGKRFGIAHSTVWRVRSGRTKEKDYPLAVRCTLDLMKHLTVEEIAQRNKVTPHNVSQQLFKVRKRLNGLLNL